MNLNGAVVELGHILAATGVTVHNVQLGQGDFPAAVIQVPDEIKYLDTFGGRAEVSIRVGIFIRANDLGTATKTLYRMLAFRSGENNSFIDQLLDNSGELTHIKRLAVNTVTDIDIATAKDGSDVLAADLNLTLHL